MDAQAGRFQDGPQIRDRRTLAIGAGDVNHRGEFALGMIEPLQELMHPLQIEIDPRRMQRGQPRDQFAEPVARSRVGRGWGRVGAHYDLGLSGDWGHGFRGGFQGGRFHQQTTEPRQRRP